LNESYIESAMQAHGGAVLRAAASVTGNRADAEEVYCDVFFALYKRREDFCSQNHLKAWLIRVAVNMAKNARKSVSRQRRVKLDETIAAPESGGGNETLDALQRLKPNERAVIYLHYYEGYVFSEIAGMLGVREGSVKSMASRARAELRELLV